MPGVVHFVELNVFGVYIAPMAAMMVVAYLLLLVLRWLALTSGLLKRVWHPALFQVALYLVVLSAIVLGAYAIGMPNLAP